MERRNLKSAKGNSFFPNILIIDDLDIELGGVDGMLEFKFEKRHVEQLDRLEAGYH